VRQLGGGTAMVGREARTDAPTSSFPACDLPSGVCLVEPHLLLNQSYAHSRPFHLWARFLRSPRVRVDTVTSPSVGNRAKNATLWGSFPHLGDSSLPSRSNPVELRESIGNRLKQAWPWSAPFCDWCPQAMLKILEIISSKTAKPISWSLI
jgi:hypothetical protein